METRLFVTFTMARTHTHNSANFDRMQIFDVIRSITWAIIIYVSRFFL